MRFKLSAAALFASLAFALGMGGPANATAAIGAAGAARTAVAADAVSPSSMAQQANHRYHKRHWNQRRWQRRDYRYHRQYRPRSGIYLQFGTPYYHQPYYHAPRRAYNLSRAHYRWCDARYRSYRASDNTFNPGKNRPRRQCISPYS